MIVEELELKSWRGYRSATTFRFDAGLNLLIGPNEAGKSTLFEAISRALFDRHSSRSAELRRIRPLGSSLGPEVKLVVRAHGQRFRVVKRFLDQARAELWAERGDRFELDHEGDRADEHIRRLLQGDPPRGSSRPAQRGLGHALWYLQRDDAIPPKAWHDALRDGLRGLLRVSLSSPEQDAVLRLVEEEYRSSFTATGRPALRGELYALGHDLPQIDAELAARRDEIARAERYREELQGIEARADSVAAEVESARKALADLDRQIEDSAEVLEAQRLCRRRLEVAELAHRELAERLERLRSLAERRSTLEESTRVSAEREDQLRALVRDHRRTAERHARRWEEELVPRLEDVRTRIADLRSKLRIEQLMREQRVLAAKLERVRKLALRLRSIESEPLLRSGPSDAEIAEAQKLAERSRMLFEAAEASAARVSFELAGGVEVEARPETKVDVERREHLVTRPTTFRLGDLGTVRVRSGDDAVARLDLEARDHARALSRLCQNHKVADLAQLEALGEQRRSSEARRQEVETRLAELTEGEGLEAEERRLREVGQELTDLERRSPQTVLPGLEGWAEERTLEQVWQLEEREKRFDRAVKEERDAEQRAQQACLQKNEELVAASQRTATLQAEVEGLLRQEAQEMPATSTLEALAAALSAAEQSVAQARSEVERSNREVAEKYERPRRERAGLFERVGRSEAELMRLRGERTDRLARIEEVAASSLDARIGDLEARRDAVGRRLEVVERRAQAAKLLRELFGSLEDARADELSAPVLEIVNPWLEQLTGRDYAEMMLDDQLLPRGLLSARYDEPLPLDSLSYGSYEQIVILLRLAIGVLLSREERQLVILDDRLVNADDERMPRLCQILEQAAEHCQILIATCREAPYSRLGGRVLRIGGHTGRFPRRVQELD